MVSIRFWRGFKHHDTILGTPKEEFEFNEGTMKRF